MCKALGPIPSTVKNDEEEEEVEGEEEEEEECLFYLKLSESCRADTSGEIDDVIL